MPLQRARSIDELYMETQDYDLVLTTDGPLSLALNRRLDKPRLGRFATTPRMLASDELAPHDRHSLFADLVTTTDLSWKQATYLIDNILECWAETDDIDAILNHIRYDTESTRQAIAAIEQAESSYLDLANYTIDDDLDVAVIGELQFTTLDCSILPDDYDTISPFATDSFDLPEFSVFDSTTAIVETVVDTITAETAEDVAVVMDRGSEYPTLVESALESADIPYYGGPGFTDQPNVRTFLRLLRKAFSSESLRVSDVRPILTTMGIDQAIEDDQKRLRSLDEPRLVPFQAFYGTVEDHTLEESLRTYERWADTSLTDLRTELDRLDLLDELVTEELLDDLEYYFQSVDIPIDESQKGVLLASANSAAYVDRPVVFYLGLGTGWTNPVPDKPWVDADQKDQQYLEQFQILLQNGVDQYFLVQDTEAGRAITPCLYFNDLLDEEFDRFTDLSHREYTHTTPATATSGFEKESIETDLDTVETISQSSLSTLVNCPRDYYFDRLVDGPNRDYIEKGNLFHDFAEFYVDHPDTVDAEGLDSIVEIMLGDMEPYVADHDLATLETELWVGAETIIRYLDEHPPEESVYEAYTNPGWENRFANQFDQPIDSPITEQWFENIDVGGKGVIDLIRTPSRLLDYKSGKHTSAKKVVENARIDEISDTPNYQALLYIAQHRDERPDEQLRFRLFQFLETLDEAVTGEEPPSLNPGLTSVTYHPTSFEAYIQRETTFEALREEGYNDCQKTFGKIDYETYHSFLDAHEIPTTYEKDELLESAFADDLMSRMKSAVGDYQYVEKGCSQALREFHSLRMENYFAPEVDAFEAFVDDRIDSLNDWRTSRFPVATDLAGEPNFDRVDHRDLILTEEHAQSPTPNDPQTSTSETTGVDR